MRARQRHGKSVWRNGNGADYSHGASCAQVVVFADTPSSCPMGKGMNTLRSAILVSVALALGACTASDPTTTLASAVPITKVKFTEEEYGVSASPRVALEPNAFVKGGGHYKVGRPYKVRGRWYTPKEEPGYVRDGKASWYGPNFHGRKTANGEIFDQNHLSAAHPTFPLPSYARVTNKANGRTVVVRVNDRGPYSHKRIIDMSKRAAEMLDFKQQGTAQVRVEYIGRAPLNGDDTEQLIASANAPMDVVRRLASQPPFSSNVAVPVAAERPVETFAPTNGMRGGL